MQVSVKLDVNITGLERYQRTVRAQLSNASDGPVHKAFFKWAIRYRAFIQRRWNVYSRGGGDWPPLKESTILARRPPARRTKVVTVQKAKASTSVNVKKPKKKKKKTTNRKASILRNTNIMYSGMAPSINPPPGSINNLFDSGIEVGFAGGDKHGDDNVTIPQLVFWHQTGAGHLPVREIIVTPDAPTVAGMVSDMQSAAEKAAE